MARGALIGGIALILGSFSPPALAQQGPVLDRGSVISALLTIDSVPLQ